MSADQHNAAESLRDLAKAARQATKAAQVPGGQNWVPDKPVPLNQMWKQYMRRYVRRNGRPYYLPSYNFLYPRERENRGWDAGNCIGPRDKKYPKPTGKRLLCHKHNYCAFCWERKRRNSGLRAALHHVNDPVIVKHSLTLPGERTDPVRVRGARKVWVKFLKKEGFEHVTAYVHTYGENPNEGVKGHLDLIASGADCHIDSINPHANPKVQEILRPFHQRPDQGFFQPFVSRREIQQPTTKKTVNELVLAGMYAGRSTLHVRRILAGLYGDQYFPNVHLTTVTGKKGCQVEAMTSAGGKPPDWTYADLLRICNEADEWDQAIGRATRPRGVRLKPKVLDEVLRDTRWRYTFRLDNEEDLKKR